jgi:lysozyme
MNREKAQNLVEQHEGRRSMAYADSLGIMTVGIGLNLEQPSAKARIAALGVDYDALCAQKCTLADSHIDSLFSGDLDTATAEAARQVPDFWNQPEEVQLAVVDMIFNMGGPRFSKFAKFIAALKARDYLTAAAEMADSKWAKQVPNRAADDIALVRGCAT